MYKVTIEGDDLKEPIVLEYECMTTNMDRGINKLFRVGEVVPFDIRLSSQGRACIKLWSGCKNYESFIAVGEERV